MPWPSRRLSWLGRGAAGIFACGAMCGSTARAQQPTPPKKPAAAAPVTSAAPRSASAHVAIEIARGLGDMPPATVVVGSSLTSDVPAPKADELALRITAQIAGRLNGAKAHPRPATLGLARSVAGRAPMLVYVQLEIRKGELRVTADAYPVVTNAWERLRSPMPAPRAHAFAAAPLDAEVRGFLTPILLESAAVHKATHDEGEVLAIGCGDVEGDGGLELVLLSRARITMGRLRGGKLVPHRTALLSTIASRAPVPAREPLASVLVAPRGHSGEILFGTTDREAVVLDGLLSPIRPLAGLPVAGGNGDACAVAVPAVSAFEGSAVTCTMHTNGAAPAKPPAPVEAFAVPAPRYDSIAAFDAVAKDGAGKRVVAARELDGKLRVRFDGDAATKPVEATMDGVGAQLAIADLDLDGVPEIVTTADAGEDSVVVSSFANGQLVPRMKLPAKDGVKALGVCPPEEDGRPGLAVVVGSEIWLVR